MNLRLQTKFSYTTFYIFNENSLTNDLTGLERIMGETLRVQTDNDFVFLKIILYLNEFI